MAHTLDTFRNLYKTHKKDYLKCMHLMGHCILEDNILNSAVMIPVGDQALFVLLSLFCLITVVYFRLG